MDKELLQQINRTIHFILQGMILQNPPSIGVDTAHTLAVLARKFDWLDEDRRLCDFLSKRFEIKGCLFLSYSECGKATSETPVTDIWQLMLASAIFSKSAVLECIYERPKGDILKKINTSLKALDMVLSPTSRDFTELKFELLKRWSEYLYNFSSSSDIESNHHLGASPVQATLSRTRNTSVLPLTVLFYEGPIARAYLETIRSLNMKPQKIFNLVASNDLISKKKVGKLLPPVLRINYAFYLQKNRIHYWPKKISKIHKPIYGPPH